MYRVPKYLLDIVLMSVFILHTTFLNWWETTFIYLLIHRMICIRVTLSLSHGGWHPKKERKKDPRGLHLSVLHAKRVSVLLCHFISFHPQTARGDRHVTSPGPWYPYIIQQAGNKNTCRTTCRLKVVISIWHQILATTTYKEMCSSSS